MKKRTRAARSAPTWNRRTRSPCTSAPLRRSAPRPQVQASPPGRRPHSWVPAQASWMKTSKRTRFDANGIAKPWFKRAGVHPLGRNNVCALPIMLNNLCISCRVDVQTWKCFLVANRYHSCAQEPPRGLPSLCPPCSLFIRKDLSPGIPLVEYRTHR